MRGRSCAAIASCAIGVLLFSACVENEERLGPAKGGEPADAPLTELQQDDGQWVTAAKDYASTRFSGLTQIDTNNARNLGLAWTFATGRLGGHEAAPIVIGSTMYIVTPYPNVLYALGLERGGGMKWKYEQPVDPAAEGVACCDAVNRGAAYAAGKVIFATLDNQVIAVDAESGDEVWRVTPVSGIPNCVQVTTYGARRSSRVIRMMGARAGPASSRRTTNMISTACWKTS